MPLSYLCTLVTHGACYRLLPMDQLALLLLDNELKQSRSRCWPLQVYIIVPSSSGPMSYEYLLQNPQGTEGLVNQTVVISGGSSQSSELRMHSDWGLMF